MQAPEPLYQLSVGGPGAPWKGVPAAPACPAASPGCPAPGTLQLTGVELLCRSRLTLHPLFHCFTYWTALRNQDDEAAPWGGRACGPCALHSSGWGMESIAQLPPCLFLNKTKVCFGCRCMCVVAFPFVFPTSAS